MQSEATAVLDTTPAKIKAPPPPLPTFKMPRTGVGRLVIWQPDPRHEYGCYPAFVTEVGDDAISVSVLIDQATALVPHDGVRHKNDPHWTEDNGQLSGVWSECPDELDRYAALDRLTLRVMEQGERIATLEQLLSK